MRRVAHPSRCAGCGAGAGYSAIRYESPCSSLVKQGKCTYAETLDRCSTAATECTRSWARPTTWPPKSCSRQNQHHRIRAWYYPISRRACRQVLPTFGDGAGASQSRGGPLGFGFVPRRSCRPEADLYKFRVSGDTGLALLRRPGSTPRDKTHTIGEGPGTTHSQPHIPYRGTSLMRNQASLGPYSRTMPRDVWMYPGFTLLRRPRGLPCDKTNTIGYGPGTTHSRI